MKTSNGSAAQRRGEARALYACTCACLVEYRARDRARHELTRALDMAERLKKPSSPTCWPTVSKGW